MLVTFLKIFLLDIIAHVNRMAMGPFIFWWLNNIIRTQYSQIPNSLVSLLIVFIKIVILKMLEISGVDIVLHTISTRIIVRYHW